MVEQKERNIIILIMFALGFLWLNFDPRLAAIFGFLVTIAGFAILTDKKQTFLVEKQKARIKSLTLAAVGYAIFIALSIIALKFLQRTELVSTYSFNSVADAFAHTMSVTMSNTAPALAENIWLTLIAFGILIPIIETWVFTLLYEVLSEIFPGINQISLKSLRTWFLITLVSLGFMFYHLTAKGLTNNDALIMVFLFFAVSLTLVLIEKQVLSAIIMHMIANTIAILNSYSITLTSNKFIVVLILGGLGYFIINSHKFNLNKIKRMVSS